MKQEKVNDVVFVMVNSKLANKAQARKSLLEHKYFDDMSSDDEWIAENNEDDENFDGDNVDWNSPIEEAFVQGVDVGSDSRAREELEVPQSDSDDDLDEEEMHRMKSLDEINEDADADEDDYLDLPLRDLIK
ncbi:MAG: hypothetical protein Q8765_02485 [Sweet potato little leaf phytoplasma]|nr:hypothetical protein [Sweet potato little leaf phytoplasma]